MCWREGSVIKSAYLANHLHGIQSLDSTKHICGKKKKFFFKKVFTALSEALSSVLSTYARHLTITYDFKGNLGLWHHTYIQTQTLITTNNKSFLKIFCTSSSSWNNLYSFLIIFPEVRILVLVPFMHKKLGL